MFSKIVRPFQAPAFDNPEEARIAGFLYPISVSSIALTAFTLLIWKMTVPPEIFARALALGLLFVLLSSFCLIAIRIKRVFAASRIAAFGSWILIMISALLFGGVRTPIFTSLVPLCVLISGVLLGRAFSFALALFSLVGGIVFVWAVQTGFLAESHNFIDGLEFHLLGTVPALVLIPVTVHVFHNHFLELVRRTRQHEIERSRAAIEKMRASQLEDKIARQKAGEKALIKATQVAEDAARSKGELLAYVSHEIRTPLNAIIGMTTLVLDRELQQEVRADVETIHQSGTVLLDILNEILDYSKVESGPVEIEEEPVSLDFLLETVIDLVAPAAQVKKLPVRYTIDEDVPRVILTDVTKLRQILLNLVANAVKFTDTGEIRVQVASQPAKSQFHHLHFSVSDTGIGIPADRIERLFQPFSQADSATARKYGGTGLGLMISRRLCEQMGGRMWVESVEAAGTTFYFTVRAKEVNNPRSLPRGGERLFPIDHLANPSLNILLVEDDLSNQKVAQRILERLGHQSDLATNGLEAVKSVRRRRYDLILMDLYMPKMDGFEATTQIRQMFPQEHCPRIVAMSAATMPKDREKALQVGMDTFLAKPIRVADLKSVLGSTNPLHSSTVSS